MFFERRASFGKGKFERQKKNLQVFNKCTKFVDMSTIDEFVKAEKLDDVIYFLAERMQRQAKLYTRQVLKENKINLTIDQWLVIKKVSEESGIVQKEIANSTFKDPAAVTRILDILVREKMVERRVSPADRRVFEIYLSKKGKKIVEKTMPLVYDIRAKGMEGLSATELRALKSGLKKMYHNLIQ